jgi:hypothetical protein
MSAIGKAIPPLLIYKGGSRDLMSSRVNEVTKHFSIHLLPWRTGGVQTRWEWYNGIVETSLLMIYLLRSTMKRLLIVDGYCEYRIYRLHGPT